MSAEHAYELLERLANLLRNQERAAGVTRGLLPVHLQVLRYLRRCNRYSDTPAAVTEYLGITKGTVSQTLGVLEEKGLVEKLESTEDRRVVHLRLTSSGRAVVDDALPPDALDEALRALPRGGEALVQDLGALLRGLQTAHGQRSFGVCGTCRHFRREAGGRGRCGLTSEPLSRDDATRICREHELAKT